MALIVGIAVILLISSRDTLQATAGADTPPPACPDGVSQCTSATIPCSTTPCPTVTAGPTANVGAGQYTYLSMANFPVGDEVRVTYCPTAEVPQVEPNPACGFGLNAVGVSLTQTKVPVGSDGTVKESFPTEVDPSGQSSAPIQATPIISTLPPDPGEKPSFFCDNGPDFCAIEVEEFPSGLSSTPETSSNTAIVPLSFSTGSNGCPSSDPVVFSDSGYSVEHLIPAAVDSTCGAPGGVADVNLATDNSQVAQDFAKGGTSLAFIDDPQDPSLQATLQGQQYKFIPVAVSATVIAFLAGDSQLSSGAPYPVGTYNLTPNMVAGLITSAYSQGYASDLLMPPLNCKLVYQCGKQTSANNYDTFDYLNPVPAGVLGPQQFGLYFSSVGTGASYQTTDWLCSAPNVGVTITVELNGAGGKPVPTQMNVTDQNAATTTLTTPPAAGIAWPPAGDPNAQWPYQHCQPYPSLPVLAASSAQYSFATSPALQAKVLRGYAYGGQSAPAPSPGGQTYAGFGAMDWSEASYFGLNSASLQNAAGTFVAPSSASIVAALNDGTTAPDGVLSYDYNKAGDSAAYPMPLVTYALVSTAAQPAAQAEAEGNLLTNLVCYSHNGGTISLPTGYVPLPDNLYSLARSEISQVFPSSETSCSGSAVGAQAPEKVGGGPTPTNPGLRPPTRPAKAGTPPSSSQLTGATGAQRTAGSVSAPPATAQTGTQAERPAWRGFEPEIIALAIGQARWILPGVAGAAVVGLFGGLLAEIPRIRRRFRRSGAHREQ